MYDPVDDVCIPDREIRTSTDSSNQTSGLSRQGPCTLPTLLSKALLADNTQYKRFVVRDPPSTVHQHRSLSFPHRTKDIRILDTRTPA